MGDVEQLRNDLEKFCSTEETQENKFDNIPSTLDIVLKKIASNGEMPFDFEWKHISQIVRRKILFCIDEMNNKAKYLPADEYTDSCDLLLQRMEMFSEAPFTIQRICELILEPEKYYKNTNKYIHALLKCLLVVSGWRKQAESDLPKIESLKEEGITEEKVEPDSTSDQVPTTRTQSGAQITNDDSDNQNVQPDSTTSDKIPAAVDDIIADSKESSEEPVFLERPKKAKDEDEEGIFGEKTTGSPVKRKIKIAPSNIQINVGKTSPTPTADTESRIEDSDTSEPQSDPTTVVEKELDGQQTDDEEKRKRKRSIEAEGEVESEVNDSPPTPTKLQKTE